MRKARLIYITPRTILDNLKLYGEDWSYNVINSTFTGNVFYKFLRQNGCISINLKNPYVGPWASVRFEMKSPPNFNLTVGMEIEGEMVLNVNGKKYIDSNGIVLNEENWTTLELEFSDIIYDKLYDRLDICNNGPDINWLKVRNIYFEPKYKYEAVTKEAQACCTFNQCICTVKRKKVYIRRNSTISDNELNDNKNGVTVTKSSLKIISFITFITSLLLIKLLFN
ncbi:hypothetical protein H8356DRAFT_378248 [Neocallimastix lanati (nom. inval.)]|nr:hypothetical protein H8356DRAFT_378248 [Neocallimastix sp. JGI-2020a]